MEDIRPHRSSHHIRPMTERFYNSLLFSVQPTPAAVMDFGIKSDRHYAALQYAVRHDGVSREDLDRALGDGPALTALIRPENPYAGVTFTTPWDGTRQENIE